MTLQDLKDNRAEIISFITLMEYDLKFAMELAVEICGNCEDLDELKEEIRNHCRPVRESKRERIMARLAEIEEEEAEGFKYACPKKV